MQMSNRTFNSSRPIVNGQLGEFSWGDFINKVGETISTVAPKVIDYQTQKAQAKRQAEIQKYQLQLQQQQYQQQQQQSLFPSLDPNYSPIFSTGNQSSLLPAIAIGGAVLLAGYFLMKD